MHWKLILDGVWMFCQDSCNVYAIRGGGADAGMLLVDAGTGAWLPYVHELPLPVKALICTHYFRDHSAGASAAAAAGIPVYVPEYERAIFEDPEQHFRERETYIIYDNLWDLFAPVTPAPVAGALRDYHHLELAGVDIEVVPLPGVTISQCGFSVVLADGSRALFCGEAIHSPGKMARIAPLQYNYNDLAGAVQCVFSASIMKQLGAGALLPSLGTPMIGDTAHALQLLDGNLRSLLSVRPNMLGLLESLSGPPLERVTDHVWRDTRSVANTWYLISDSGKALAIDYGYHLATCAAWPGYSRPARRRALLHGIDGLMQQFGIDRIDVALVSHFHDDHVSGIPVLQRMYGTRCWAAENFADMLEYPEAHCFPCNWPVAARVDRRLKLDEPFEWEEFRFELHPMSGHTRFAALIGFEADGKRFAHTGDQYFFNNGVSSFAGNTRSQNHVFRNGALLDGYEQSGAWMQAFRPDVVIQGHQPAMWTDAEFFRHIEAWSQDYAQLAAQIMPLAEADAHFNLDSWGGWIWPYRTHLKEPKPFNLRVTVRNPLPQHAELTVTPVLPAGWTAGEVRVQAAPRAEVECTVSITPAGECRRQPVAVMLAANDKRFGQVAEALVTIGRDRF